MTGLHNTTTEAQIHDRDVREPSPSAGWRETYAVLEAPLPGDDPGADPDRVAGATRRDRPARYRRKHRRGVTS